MIGLSVLTVMVKCHIFHVFLHVKLVDSISIKAINVGVFFWTRACLTRWPLFPPGVTMMSLHCWEGHISLTGALDKNWGWVVGFRDLFTLITHITEFSCSFHSFCAKYGNPYIDNDLFRIICIIKNNWVLNHRTKFLFGPTLDGHFLRVSCLVIWHIDAKHRHNKQGCNKTAFWLLEFVIQPLFAVLKRNWINRRRWFITVL